MKIYQKIIHEGTLKFTIHVEGAKGELPARAFVNPPGNEDPLRGFIVPAGDWDIEIEMAPLTTDGMICVLTRTGKGTKE